MLGLLCLHVPPDQENMKIKIAEVEVKFGMVQAFGAIDGTHIPITTPSTNSQDCYHYIHLFTH